MGMDDFTMLEPARIQGHIPPLREVSPLVVLRSTDFSPDVPDKKQSGLEQYNYYTGDMDEGAASPVSSIYTIRTGISRRTPRCAGALLQV